MASEVTSGACARGMLSRGRCCCCGDDDGDGGCGSSGKSSYNTRAPYHPPSISGCGGPASQPARVQSPRSSGWPDGGYRVTCFFTRFDHLPHPRLRELPHTFPLRAGSRTALAPHLYREAAAPRIDAAFVSCLPLMCTCHKHVQTSFLFFFPSLSVSLH